MAEINAGTGLCAVIGDPVEHSLSPVLHNAAFRSVGLNYVYLAFRVRDVAGCLAGMRAMRGFRGLNVTIPHKMAVAKLLDELDPLAAKTASVNTVVNDDGRLIGYTTDGQAVLKACEEAGVALNGAAVLFLGSGGAVRAAAFAVAELAKPSKVTVLGRTLRRVHKLVDDVRTGTQTDVNGGALSADLPAAMAGHDVIIHGTPLGMDSHSPGATCVPRALFRRGQVVFDMVYRPAETRLLRDAADAGCKTIGGLEMLVHQAAVPFERWTGRPAPLDVMRRAVVEALVNEAGEVNRTPGEESSGETL